MRRGLAVLTASGLALAIVGGISSGAWAYPSPIDAKNADALSLQREIQGNVEKISVLTKRRDEAWLRLVIATNRVAQAGAHLALARAETHRMESVARLMVTTNTGAANGPPAWIHVSSLDQ